MKKRILTLLAAVCLLSAVLSGCGGGSQTGTAGNTEQNTAAPAARTAKGSAAPALPQTGDAFPVEALAAALCAGLVGFATAWSKHR